MATERTDSVGAVAGLHRRSAAERIHETVRYLLRSWELYVFVLPAVIHVLLFRYLPIYGLRIAFTDETLQEIRAEWPLRAPPGSQPRETLMNTASSRRTAD